MSAELIALRNSLPGKVLVGSSGVMYHLRERIGEGGQGWVFTAHWDEPDGFLVIVKVLRPDVVSDESLDRFRREAQALRLLEQKGMPCPYIVRFFDHAAARVPSPSDGKLVKLPFTVLEYVRGTNLEKVLEATGGKGLPLSRVRRIARHVAVALDAVHAQHIIHRDLKPSNILLATDGNAEVAKITDFGLVKLHAIDLRSTVTLAGASLGYAPPEQFEPRNERVGPRTDVYSLGAIIYEMITGTRAYTMAGVENPIAIVRRMIEEERTPLADLTSQLSPELQGRPDLIAGMEEALGRALRTDVTARYPSAGAFWTELDPIFRAAVDGLPYGPTELDPSRATDGRPLAVRPPTDQPPRSEARLSVALPRRDAEQRVSGELPQTSLAWRFRVISPAVRTLRLVRAKVSETGDISAIGPAGLVEWRLSDAKVGWVPVLLPAGVSGPQLRALARLPSGEVFLAGDTALVVRIGSDGKSEAWRLTREPVDFFALDLDPSGVRVVLAGRQAASRDKQAHGVLIEAARGQIRSHHVVAGTEKLRAVRYDDACAIAACGDGGLFARLAPGGAVVQTKLCDGNLYDLAVVPTGGFTIVGSGGYALWITPSGETSIDAVRTTQDLLCVSISDDGAAWAGGRKGRLLYRQNEEWHRIALEPQLEATSVVGIGALQDRILCVFDDGTVVEGLPEAR